MSTLDAGQAANGDSSDLASNMLNPPDQEEDDAWLYGTEARDNKETTSSNSKQIDESDLADYINNEKENEVANLFPSDKENIQESQEINYEMSENEETSRAIPSIQDTDATNDNSNENEQTNTLSGVDNDEDEDDDDDDDDDDDNMVKITISDIQHKPYSQQTPAGGNPLLTRQKSKTNQILTGPGAVVPNGTVPGAAGAIITNQNANQAGVIKAKGVDLDAPGTINDLPTYDYDLEEVKDEDKPWRKPGADITDYFNYGFTEETWIGYCMKQKRLRSENSALKSNLQLMNQQNATNPIQTTTNLSGMNANLNQNGAPSGSGSLIVPIQVSYGNGSTNNPNLAGSHHHQNLINAQANQQANQMGGNLGNMPHIHNPNMNQNFQHKQMQYPVRFQQMPPSVHPTQLPHMQQLQPSMLQQQQQRKPNQIDVLNEQNARRNIPGMFPDNTGDNTQGIGIGNNFVPNNQLSMPDFSAPPPGWQGPPGTGPPPNIGQQQPQQANMMNRMQGIGGMPPRMPMTNLPPPQVLSQQPPQAANQGAGFQGGPISSFSSYNYPPPQGVGVGVPPPIHHPSERPPPSHFNYPPPFGRGPNPSGHPPQMIPPPGAQPQHNINMGSAWEKPTVEQQSYFNNESPSQKQQRHNRSSKSPTPNVNSPSRNRSSKSPSAQRQQQMQQPQQQSDSHSKYSKDGDGKQSTSSSSYKHRSSGDYSSRDYDRDHRRSSPSSPRRSSHRHREHDRRDYRDNRDRSKNRDRDRSRERSRSRDDKYKRSSRRKSEDDDYRSSSKSHKRSKKSSRKDRDSSEREQSSSNTNQSASQAQSSNGAQENQSNN